jgi:hypothetical protein
LPPLISASSIAATCRYGATGPVGSIIKRTYPCDH